MYQGLTLCYCIVFVILRPQKEIMFLAVFGFLSLPAMCIEDEKLQFKFELQTLRYHLQWKSVKARTFEYFQGTAPKTAKKGQKGDFSFYVWRTFSEIAPVPQGGSRKEAKQPVQAAFLNFLRGVNRVALQPLPSA